MSQWEALREDEIACRSLGLSPRRIKLTAFTISAAFAGFAGTLFAARQGFVSPESFTFAESAFVLAIVVLGGMGSQFAVILAAILLVVSRELMRDFNEYSMLMLGGLMVLMMICAGASEQSVSQWASTFAEKGLGVSKTVGDLAGPMAFAILMGSARAFYGKYGEKINLEKFMVGSSILCVAAYLCIALVPNPLIGLIACAVCGLSVGIMWPGTFSKAAAALPGGGTAMFAFMALAGDLGCSGGPTLVGTVSGIFVFKI